MVLRSKQGSPEIAWSPLPATSCAVLLSLALPSFQAFRCGAAMSAPQKIRTDAGRALI